MILREFISKINEIGKRDELLDLEVHIITETDRMQQEQVLGGIAIPTSYKNESKVGTPIRIVLYSENFD